MYSNRKYLYISEKRKNSKGMIFSRVQVPKVRKKLQKIKGQKPGLKNRKNLVKQGFWARLVLTYEDDFPCRCLSANPAALWKASYHICKSPHITRSFQVWSRPREKQKTRTTAEWSLFFGVIGQNYNLSKICQIDCEQNCTPFGKILTDVARRCDNI